MNATARKFLPFLNWFPLDGATLRADFVAGISVALLAIPQSLAYAQLAGVPAYYGLYAALIPTVIGVLFGSSAILSTGPVAITSLLTAASVSALAAHGTEQFYSYVMLLALVSGLFQIVFGVLRIGVLINFVSHPVLMGFVNAAVIVISLAQVPTLLGISSKPSDHLLLDTWHVITNLDTLHELSLAFGVCAIALLVGFRKYAPRWPGVLIVVGTLTLVSYVVDYAAMGGRVVGDVPRGLPSLTLPPLDWQVATALIPGGFIIALISFMEVMSSGKVIAIKTRTPWDENQELIGQGLAKVAAAFCHSMPVSGSFSRSALNLSSGARSGVSSLVSAAFVLLTLLYFTDVLYHLPKPVLAAIIIVAVAALVDYGSIRRAWLAGRDDGIAAVATFFATLLFAPGIHVGILTGIILSLAILLYRTMRPRVSVVSMHQDGMMRDMHRLHLPALRPGLSALRFDGSLIFINVSYFEDAVMNLAREVPGLQYILVVGNGINALDASGAEVLANLVSRLNASGIALGFSGIKWQVKDVMDRAGLAAKIGEDNFFATDAAALEALYRRLAAGSPTAQPAI
jgi:SulP family sulfate permease